MIFQIPKPIRPAYGPFLGFDFAPAFASEHQCRGRDPEQEDDDIAGDADDGAGFAAAGERVFLEMVRDDGVEGEGEGEDGRYHWMNRC